MDGKKSPNGGRDLSIRVTNTSPFSPPPPPAVVSTTSFNTNSTIGPPGDVNIAILPSSFAKPHTKKNLCLLFWEQHQSPPAIISLRKRQNDQTTALAISSTKAEDRQQQRRRRRAEESREIKAARIAKEIRIKGEEEEDLEEEDEEEEEDFSIEEYSSRTSLSLLPPIIEPFP